MRADHLLHVTPSPWGVTYRLECLPPADEHFTAAVDDWCGSADELEANGVAVDRSTCWVHAWLDNADSPEDWMKEGDWPEDGPWPVCCSFGGALDVEYVPPSEAKHFDQGAPT